MLLAVKSLSTNSLYNVTYFWDFALRSVQQPREIFSQKSVSVGVMYSSYYGRRYCLHIVPGFPVPIKTARFFYKYQYNLLKLCECNSMNIWKIVTSQCRFVNLRREQKDFIVYVLVIITYVSLFITVTYLLITQGKFQFSKRVFFPMARQPLGA
jgi:hypothetical protein